MGIGRPRFPRAPSNIRRLARRMRDEQTPAKRKLWRAMRSRLPIEGSHFRRQVSLGPYIVDFCSLGAKLVIEVDGNQHGEEEARARDAERERYLSQNGFLVLRFSNRDVMSEIDVVLDTIFNALNDASPTTSRPGSTELPPP